MGTGRSRFRHGQRVELAAVTYGYARFGPTAGQRGTVEFTDSLGTVHVIWDSGTRFGIIAEDAELLRAISPDAPALAELAHLSVPG